MFTSMSDEGFPSSTESRGSVLACITSEGHMTFYTHWLHHYD